MKMNFDPMTGEPIQGNGVQDEQMSFDPMTGEPIRGNGVQDEQVSFDPMTGEPIQGNGGQNEQVSFDPMTGEPIRGNGVQDERMRFDPMTGKPIAGSAKSVLPKGIPAVAGIAAAVLIVGVVAVKAAPRIMLGKNYKIVQALGNTLESNHLLEDLSFADLVSDGSYTVAVDCSAGGADADVSIAVDLDAKKLSLGGSGSYKGVHLDGTAYMDDSQLLISIPELTDQPLLYSYTEEKDGCLEDILEYAGLDIDDLDDALKSVFETSSGEDFEKDLKDASIKAFKAMDFEKTDKRKVEVNGKDRSCQGYMLELDEDLILDLCDIYEDALEPYMDGLKTVAGSYDASDLFDDIRDSADEIDGAELTVYLCKKKVAAVAIEDGGDELVLELHGGNYAWENASLEYNEYELMELSGSVEQKTEKLTLEMYGEEIFDYHYNYKTGDWTLTAGDEELELEANVSRGRNSAVYVLSDLYIMGNSIDLEGQITVKDQADVSKISAKDALDIGNASEDDLMDLFEDDLMDLFEGIRDVL